MISSKMFNYHKNEKLFTQEISTLGKVKMIQVYPDACDEGFEMVSDKTGQIVKFVKTQTHYNDGDVTHWEFKGLGAAKGCTAIIWND